MGYYLVMVRFFWIFRTLLCTCESWNQSRFYSAPQPCKCERCCEFGRALSWIIVQNFTRILLDFAKIINQYTGFVWELLQRSGGSRERMERGPTPLRNWTSSNKVRRTCCNCKLGQSMIIPLRHAKEVSNENRVGS